ncbi:MAG: hypothetical protein ACFFDW_05160 [Candidatus Thorarchaeota archaeon]
MNLPILTTVKREFLNTKVTLKGVLAESKAGVCVKLENDIVFLFYDKEFDEELFGNLILITGTLVERKFIPDVVIGEDGAINQGAPGKQYILENIIKINFPTI